MHWVSKAVKATVGAAERRADIKHEWHIARKTTTKRAAERRADIQHERNIARKQLQIERVLSRFSTCSM